MTKGSRLSDQEEGHSRVPSEQSIIGNTKKEREKIIAPKVQEKSPILFMLSHLSGNSLNSGNRD